MTEARQPNSMTRRSMLRMVFAAASTVAGAGILAACGQAPAPTATTAPAPTKAPAAAATTAPTAAAATKAPAATTAPAAATATPAAKPAASGEKVTVRVFNRATAINELVKGGADEFMKKNPNVTVSWEGAPPGEDLRKMLVMAASNTSPDIQWQCTPCDWMLYMHAGLALDVLPLVKSHNFDLNQFIPSAVATPTIGGKMWAMPYWSHPGYPAMIINTTMFEKAGVPVPMENWTEGPHPGWKGWDYDAFKAAVLKMTVRESGRVVSWGLQMRGPANPMNVMQAAMRSDGSDYLNKEGTKVQFNNDVGRKFLNLYGELYTKSKAAPLLADMPSGGPDLMASNRVAIRNAPTWAISTAQQLFKDFKWKVIPAPLGSQGNDSWGETNFFQMLKSSKNPDVAFDVLTHIVDAKWGWASYEAGGIPGSQREFWDKDSKLSKDPNWAVFAMAMRTCSAPVMPANGRYTELTNTFIAQLDPVWTGQDVDINKLIDGFMPKLQAIVDQKPPSIEELAKPS